MTHHITPEGEARPGPAHGHCARALAVDDDALLDHHIEELLSALGDLDRRGRDAGLESIL